MELASGVDALYLSGHAGVPPSLLERLTAARELAEEAGSDQSFELGGVPFQVAGHGMGKYRFCLVHRYGQLGLTPSGHLPPIRLQLRTEFIHGVGIMGAVRWFEELLAQEVGPCVFTVSRIDLYVDLQGWLPRGDDRHLFVCRGRERDTYERDGELTGFTFGRRKSGTLTARIYNKTIDAERKAGLTELVGTR